ncbi:VOC family protein [Hellea sp.]|nr:VOC family protein [Hellea sp.]
MNSQAILGRSIFESYGLVANVNAQALHALLEILALIPMDINGLAHIILTAGDFEKSTAFYREFLPKLGMTIVLDNNEMLYGVGARTALGIRPPSDVNNGKTFDQGHVGLHHYCFRAKNTETVDEVHDVLKGLDAKIIHAPEKGPWAPGYYSVLFEDPDGIRGEVNYVPGKGLLKDT